jgi:hypothetical protein
VDSDRQYNSTTVWMCLAWAVSIVLIALGAVVGVGRAGSEQARMIGISIMAVGFLFVAAAVCLTVRVMLRDQARYLLGMMATHDDVSRLHNGRLVKQ